MLQRVLRFWPFHAIRYFIASLKYQLHIYILCQFMAQEPGTNEEIKCFVAGYKADGKFDLFAKTCVNGDGAHPLWKYLRHKNVGSPISD